LSKFVWIKRRKENQCISHSLPFVIIACTSISDRQKGNTVLSGHGYKSKQPHPNPKLRSACVPDDSRLLLAAAKEQDEMCFLTGPYLSLFRFAPGYGGPISGGDVAMPADAQAILNPSLISELYLQRSKSALSKLYSEKARIDVDLAAEITVDTIVLSDRPVVS